MVAMNLLEWFSERKYMANKALADSNSNHFQRMLENVMEAFKEKPKLMKKMRHFFLSRRGSRRGFSSPPHLSEAQVLFLMEKGIVMAVKEFKTGYCLYPAMMVLEVFDRVDESGQLIGLTSDVELTSSASVLPPPSSSKKRGGRCNRDDYDDSSKHGLRSIATKYNYRELLNCGEVASVDFSGWMADDEHEEVTEEYTMRF